MLEELMTIFNKQRLQYDQMTKDAIAELLRINPSMVEKFEAAYRKHVIDSDSDNIFDVNAKQAAKSNHIIEQLDRQAMHMNDIDIIELQDRIVNELLERTSIYTFDGILTKTKPISLLSDRPNTPLTVDELRKIPVEIRPQLAGELMKVDIDVPSYHSLLWFYDRYLNGRTQQIRTDAYHRFRQGLDILDLDEITYDIISTNRNSMGHWLPQLVTACMDQEFFKIPATTIATVPLTLLQLTRLDYNTLTPSTIAIVDKWAQKAFSLDTNKEYFIKTGTYSSKYDFRNAYVHGENEVKELGEYLLFIHFQALQMASPTCRPCIYGVSTTNEWVVREFIHDKENNPCIYKGLPLHTEYRVFVDCDVNKIIGITPYWEPNTMKQRFGNESDSNSLHQLHDYVIYKAHEETLMNRYNQNKDIVITNIEKILPNLNLTGQWSIDIMQNGDDFWIIDMALAENSAFYQDCVPEYLRNPSKENWIPELSDMSDNSV